MPVQIEFDLRDISTQPDQTIDDFKKTVEERYMLLCETLVSKKVWNHSIFNIVFCSDLEKYVEEFNIKYQSQFTTSKEKEFTGKALNLSRTSGNEEKITIALSFDVFMIGFSLMDQMFFNQVFIETSHLHLPKELLFKKINGLNYEQANNIDSVIQQSFAIWFSYHFTQFYLDELCSNDLNPQAHDKFMINFKRNVRKLLFDAQSDKAGESRWMFVWQNYAYHFTVLIRNLITDRTNDKNLHLQNEKEARICYELCDEIKKNYVKVMRKEEINLERIKELFIEFARTLSIQISQNESQKSQGISFNIGINPKVIFKDVVVETIPSFVAFIDILGFSKMIEKYQSDPQSTLLQKLKEAFDSAINETKKAIEQLEGSYLEYRLFSDNFSAAIPFFDSKNDFFAGLHIILLLIKNYNYQLMMKGFFVRGGFSHGDYYSDENMIFSGALVDAYILESKKANYPRILISKKTIQEIENYLIEDENLPENLNKSIIYCIEEDVYFVNPYLDLKYQFDSFIELTEKYIPELASYLQSIINSEMEIITDENVLEPIQKELLFQMENLQKEENQRAFEKLEWLYQFNEWYINKDSPKYEFYRS